MNRRNFLGLTTVASLSPARGADENPRERPILGFGLITDVQYADAEPQGERHYRASTAKLQAAVEWLAERKPSFTLHLGDLIDRDFKSFDAVLPLLDRLGHPVHHLLGNHDYEVADGKKRRVAEKLGMPADYYSFRSGGVRFVMLDTNDLSIYKHSKGSAGAITGAEMLAKLQAENAPGAKPWNGGLSGKQLAWLDGELAAAGAAGEAAIVCGHHSLLPAEGHQTWNADEVLAVIGRHPCVAYFNGHNHAGAEVVRGGVPFITFKSILHEPDVTAFSLVRLYADRLEIEGSGREKSRVIALRR